MGAGGPPRTAAKAKKPRAAPGSVKAARAGPAGPLSLTFVGGEGGAKAAKLGGTFECSYDDGAAVTIAELKTLCRKTFGKASVRPPRRAV